MAVAYRSDTGKLVVDNFNVSQTISFVTQPVAGDLVVAGGAFYGGGSAFTPSVSDNQGNTYALDVSTDIVAGGSAPFGVNGAAIFSKENVANAGTLTLSFGTGGNSGSFIAVGGICFSGVATLSALDVTAKANAADIAKTSQVSGTTGTTAQADSVAVTALSVGNSGTLLTLTVPGYTVPIAEVDGTTHAVGGLAYNILTATGAQTATWTYGQSSGSSNDDHGAVIAVYKGANAAPTIDTQPASINVVVGQTATFSVAATGATSYQWQDNSSGSFADIGGATSSTYTTAATTSLFQRRQYRCVISNASGSVNSSSVSLTLSWHDVYLYAMPEDADADDVRLRDPTQAAAGGTHATTGALAADAATIAGTAAHSALHATSGALAAQSAAIAGTAAHLLLHTSTGALSAQAAVIAGTAAHQHATTGALSAQAATIAGSAAHQHATSGALSAQAAAVAGTAAHATLHTSTGALTAQDATIAGTAADEHSNTGALSAQAATIAGTADHRTLHTSTGALSAQSAAIAGTAAHQHATSGALTAQAATIAGTAAHQHVATGALAAQAAAIAGTADHRTLHTSTGALSSQAAAISGTAAHEHATAGALAAQAATIAGAADHIIPGSTHSTSGSLAAQDAAIAGSATHLTLHATSGALAAQSSSIAGTAAHQHVATGALAADAATISGAAAHEHTSTGALAAQAATVAGVAEHSAAGTHDATGALTAGDASLSGLAEHVGADAGLLDPKLIAKKRRQNQNITFKGAGGQAPRKKRDEAPEPVKAKISPLLLGLMARGLAMPTPPAAPMLPEPAPVLDVASIAQAMLVAAIEVPKPEVPLTLEQQLAARVEQLERENAQLQAELTALRTPPEPVQATPRDPIHEALHALLPALADPIDLDAVPDEPEEEPPAAAPPVEQPAKMTPEQIDAENRRRALAITALLI